MVESPAGTMASPGRSVPKPRIALVCDLAEEKWPSMDLVADMLFRYLPQDASNGTVTRLCPPLRKRLGRLPSPRPALFHNADRLLNRFVDYPRWLRERTQEFDLFHVIDHSYAQLVHDLPAGRSVVTCHDLDTFRCVLDPEREARPRWFRAMTSRILSGFQKAAHVIAVSAATRDDILRRGLLPADRVTVVPNGVHPSCSPLPDPDADAELARLLPSDAENSIWLLNVGSTMPRKRLDLLLRVVAELLKQAPNVRLLRVGGPLTAAQAALAKELGVAQAVVELPSLNRAVLAAAYRRADVLLHTAEAEGFGLPVIEALACGCPVVASDLAVLREVGGAAVAYCGIGDMEAWKNTVLGVIERSPQGAVPFRFDRERAIAQAGRFSFLENARATSRIYENILRKALWQNEL